MTKIEWADKSWNPVTGCTKVSPGCKNCYAERMARRLAGRHGYPEAPNHFDVRLHPDRLAQPLRWRKPRRVFVCSMGDLFHEAVPDRFVARVLTAMGNAGQHTYQILTKRPDRMRELFNRKSWRDDYSGLYQAERENWWFGVSVENQATADARIPLLLQTPAAVRFVSLEPLLGAVDVAEYLTPWLCTEVGSKKHPAGYRPSLSWVICGGESGPGARPMHPDWARDVRGQCQAAGVPYFHKQNGVYIPADGWNQWGTSLDGGFVDPRKVRSVQVMPRDVYSTVHMVRVGKERAGRLLDGQLWEEYPRCGKSVEEES